MEEASFNCIHEIIQIRNARKKETFPNAQKIINNKAKTVLNLLENIYRAFYFNHKTNFSAQLD